MNHKELARAAVQLDDAGTPADRYALRTSLADRLRGDLTLHTARLRALEADHRRFLSSWTTEHVSVGTIPTRLPEDVHALRRYLVGGLVALTAEALLAAWIFALRGVLPLFGILAAVCITLVFDRALELLLIAKNPRPKEALRTLKRWLVLPAFLTFLLAAAFLALARYVEGGLALLLLPLFTGALWAATMALLLLAAALFCAAHLYGTTLRQEEEYTALDREARHNLTFLRELEREDQLVEVGTIPLDGNGRGSRSSFQTSRGIHAILLLLTALGSLAGCRPAQGSVGTRTVTARSESARCDIVFDLSGSVVGLDQAWTHVRAELLAIITAAHCGELTISGFDVDGWALRPLAPPLLLPVRRTASEAQLGEWGVFSNVHDAAQVEENRQFTAALVESLCALDSSTVVPDEIPDAKGSDVVGVLQRFAALQDREPRVVLLVTDLADSHHRTLPAIPPPASPVRLVVLLAPAKPRDAKLTMGRELSGADQYLDRSAQLRRAAPWITVVPYFTEGLAEIIAAVPPVARAGECAGVGSHASAGTLARSC